MINLIEGWESKYCLTEEFILTRFLVPFHRLEKEQEQFLIET